MSNVQRRQTKVRENGKSENKRIRRANRGNDNEIDYTAIDPGLLHRAVVAVTKRHCAIQFGYTRDGSALVVRIVGDGEAYNEYVRSTENPVLYFEGLIADFESE